MSVNVELEATCIKCDNGNDNDSTEWNEIHWNTQMERVEPWWEDASQGLLTTGMTKKISKLLNEYEFA